MTIRSKKSRNTLRKPAAIFRRKTVKSPFTLRAMRDGTRTQHHPWSLVTDPEILSSSCPLLKYPTFPWKCPQSFHFLLCYSGKHDFGTLCCKMFWHGIKILLYNNNITLGEFSQIVFFLYSYSKNNRNKGGLVIVNTHNQWPKESHMWKPGQA